MSKRKPHRFENASAESRAQSAASPPSEPAGRELAILAVVWAAIAVYVLAFYGMPLSTPVPGTQAALRRADVLVALFEGDRIVADWFIDSAWRAAGQRAVIVLAAGMISCVAWAAGWAALRATGIDRRLTRLETFVFSAGIGANLVSTLTLALGLCGLLRRDVFAGVGIAIVGAAAFLVWRRATVNRDADVAAVAGPAGLSSRWLWLGLPFLLAIVLGAMLPPIEFDVREYHLQAPKEFFEAGRIGFLPHNVYANMPLGAEMLGLAGMVVCDDWWTGALVGKTLIALFAPLAALLLLAAGRRFVTPAAGVVAALVYLSIPWIALESTQGLVEGVFAFYLFAAVFGAMLWQESTTPTGRDSRLLWLTGFLAGGAVSTKYPAVVYCVVPLAAWIVYQSLATKRDRKTPRPALLPSAARSLTTFLAFTALGCGLWLAKNAALTGNPVYPLIYGVFDGRTRTVDNNAQWTRAHRPPNFDLSDLASRAAGVTLKSDWLSPLLVPLAALAFVGPRRRWTWWLALYFGLVFFSWWLFTHRIDRFWTPILPVAALLAGIGSTWSDARWWRVPFRVFLVLGLISNLVFITSGTLGDVRYFADLQVLRVDPGRVGPWHRYLNAHADDVSGVLLVGDAQPFDLEVPARYNTVFDDNLFEQLALDHTSAEIHRLLVEQNTSHVLVAWGEVNRYRQPGNYGITDFIEPEIFARLVRDGVLVREPALADDSGELFRVAPLTASPKRPVDEVRH